MTREERRELERDALGLVGVQHVSGAGDNRALGVRDDRLELPHDGASERAVGSDHIQHWRGDARDPRTIERPRVDGIDVREERHRVVQCLLRTARHRARQVGPPVGVDSPHPHVHRAARVTGPGARNHGFDRFTKQLVPVKIHAVEGRLLQHQRPDSVGGIEGELERDHAAARVTDDVRTLDRKMVEERQGVIDMTPDRDLTVEPVASGVAAAVVPDEAAPPCECGLLHEGAVRRRGSRVDEEHGIAIRVATYLEFEAGGLLHRDKSRWRTEPEPPMHAYPEVAYQRGARRDGSDGKAKGVERVCGRISHRPVSP